ncbi:MAG: CinA family protein [Rickettsiales bacterium]|nr:CinA family protein [Rickettsiales bacterium]
MFNQNIIKLSEEIIEKASLSNSMIALAESCTGGLISSALTEIAGSSKVLDRCAVTYSNLAKQQMLDVKPETLEKFGAVSEETSREMALGIMAKSQAKYGFSVTGIAGPNGCSEQKPVGLVYIAFADKLTGRNKSFKHNFLGSRNEIRLQAVEEVLKLVLEIIRR